MSDSDNGSDCLTGGLFRTNSWPSLMETKNVSKKQIEMMVESSHGSNSSKKSGLEKPEEVYAVGKEGDKELENWDGDARTSFQPRNGNHGRYYQSGGNYQHFQSDRFGSGKVGNLYTSLQNYQQHFGSHRRPFQDKGDADMEINKHQPGSMNCGLYLSPMVLRQEQSAVVNRQPGTAGSGSSISADNPDENYRSAGMQLPLESSFQLEASSRNMMEQSFDRESGRVFQRPGSPPQGFSRVLPPMVNMGHPGNPQNMSFYDDDKMLPASDYGAASLEVQKPQYVQGQAPRSLQLGHMHPNQIQGEFYSPTPMHDGQYPRSTSIRGSMSGSSGPMPPPRMPGLMHGCGAPLYGVPRQLHSIFGGSTRSLPSFSNSGTVFRSPLPPSSQGRMLAIPNQQMDTLPEFQSIPREFLTSPSMEDKSTANWLYNSYVQSPNKRRSAFLEKSQRGMELFNADYDNSNKSEDVPLPKEKLLTSGPAAAENQESRNKVMFEIDEKLFHDPRPIRNFVQPGQKEFSLFGDNMSDALKKVYDVNKMDFGVSWEISSTRMLSTTVEKWPVDYIGQDLKGLRKEVVLSKRPLEKSIISDPLVPQTQAQYVPASGDQFGSIWNFPDPSTSEPIGAYGLKSLAAFCSLEEVAKSPMGHVTFSGVNIRKIIKGLDQKTPIIGKFAGPFAEHSHLLGPTDIGVTKSIKEYDLPNHPNCNERQKLEWKEKIYITNNKMAFFSFETLIYMFYMITGVSLQHLVAHELYRRGWRYHKVFQVWLMPAEEPLSSWRDQGYGAPFISGPVEGNFKYFHHGNWKFDICKLKLQPGVLDTFSAVPPMIDDTNN